MTQDKIKLFIVDNDPIFRLGLRTALEKYPDFEVVGDGNISKDTWRKLTKGLVLNILAIGISSDTNKSKFSSQQFCQQIMNLYPELPLFLLVADWNYRQIATIKSWRVKGYCAKSSSIKTVIDGLYAVAYGNFYWQDRDIPLNFWQQTLVRLSSSGKQQLEDSLEDIEQKLDNEDLSDWERAFLMGRKRELLAARWVANRIVSEDLTPAKTESNSLPISSKADLTVSPSVELDRPIFAEDRATKAIFERILVDIRLSVVNLTKITLEIDILKPQQQQDLLIIVLNCLNKTLEKLRYENNSNFTVESVLRSIWEEATQHFFCKYYGRDTELEREQLAQITEQEFGSIRANVLTHIYYASELFTFLLDNPDNFVVDNFIYESQAPEVLDRIEFLLHNLIIHLANGVMQVILNNFYELEIFKYNLYQEKYRSSREIARFRNELSWRYRQEVYWDNPKNIFESRYRLLVFSNGKIRTLFIYAPRREELELLTGLPWLVTMAIELRDAIAPRLRTILAFAGSGVVFILTQVIGKGIGLIGKGIIQGIGSTVKDVPYNKNNRKK